MNDTKKPNGMLVLTRRAREGQDTILIEHKLEIVIVSIHGNSVQLGFRTTDDSFPNIVRKEIYVGPNDPAANRKPGKR